MRKALITATALSLTIAAYSQNSKNEFSTAMNLIADKNYVAALPVLERTLDQLSSDEIIERNALEFYIVMSKSYMNSQEAESEIESFLEQNPSSPYRYEAIFALAGIYNEKGEYKKSSQLYGSIDEATLDSSQIERYYFNYGYSLIQNEEYPLAKEYLQKAESTGQKGREATYYIAYIDYLNEDFESAKERFRRVADMEQFRGSVPYYMLQMEFADGNYSQVTNQGRSLLQSAKEQYKGELCRIIGESYFHQKEYDKAIDYLKRYSSYNGTMGRNENYLLGYSLYMRKDYRGAIDNLKSIIEGEDNLSQNAYYHLGDCYLKNNDKKGALQAFSMASSFGDDKSIAEDALYNLVKLQYEMTGSGVVYDRAITSINDYIKIYPQSSHREELQSILVDAYVNSGNYEQAYQAISEIKVKDNHTKEALQKVAYMRGVDFFANGKREEADKMFDVSLSNSLSAKYTALSRFWKAEIIYSMGNYERAAQLYKEYINVAPRNADEYSLALYNLGYCYFNRSFFEDAATWFERYLSSLSNETSLVADSHNRMGDIKFSQRKYDDALSQYGKALNMDPLNSYSMYQQAMSYGLLSNKSRKRDILNTIISDTKLSGRDEAMLELGRTLIRDGEYNQGAMMLLKLRSEMPMSPLMVNALSELGLAYQNMGDNSSATTYYKEVVENFGQSPQAKDAMLGLKSIYTESGNVNEYFDFARKIGLDTNSSGEKESMVYASAEKVYASGKYEEAAIRLSEYISEFPSAEKKAAATYMLADCYKRMGDEQNALKYYSLVATMSVNQFTAKSIILASEILIKEGAMEQAYNMLRGIEAATTQKSIISQANYMALEAAVALDDRSKSEALAEMIISDKSTTPTYRPLAYLVRGRYRVADRKYDMAIADLKKASTELKSRTGAEAKYLLAKALFMDNNSVAAQKEILDFSKRGTPQRDILARSFLLLGDIYLFKGDSFQAKATYQSVIDGYENSEDGIKEEAENKRNQIK